MLRVVQAAAWTNGLFRFRYAIVTYKRRRIIR